MVCGVKMYVGKMKMLRISDEEHMGVETSRRRTEQAHRHRYLEERID